MTTLPRSRVPGLSLAKVREQRPRAPSAPGAAVVYLTLLGGVLAAAVFADGGAIPEAWLACEFAAGLLVAFWAAAGKRPRATVLAATVPPTPGFRLAVLALPLYAILQAVPLPLMLVRLLSPARAELHESVSSWMVHAPSWTPLSVHPEATLDLALRLGAYAAVYWMVSSLATRLARKRFAVAAPVVIVAAAQSVIALLQNLAGDAATGSYVNRNHLAGLLEMALPFAVVPAIFSPSAGSLVPVVSRGRARGENPRASVGGWRLPAGAAAVLIFTAILTTRSRGGLIAALISLLMVGLAALKRSALPPRKWWLAALLPALLVAALLYLPSDNLVRRYAGVLGGEALRREGRVLLWNETLDLIAAYPLVGCGFGAFEPAFLRYKRSAPMVTDTHAHNDYLELLAEAGVIGFALCLLLAAGPIAAALGAGLCGKSGQGSSLTVACAASLGAILAHSLVDFNLRIPANGMVFVWVLALCSARGNTVGQSLRLQRRAWSRCDPAPLAALNDGRKINADGRVPGAPNSVTAQNLSTRLSLRP